MRAYLANALFSEADFRFNDYLAGKIRSEIDGIELYLPQHNDSLNDKSSYANSTMISRGDDDYLLNSHFMIAVIDGATIDEGVACEIGKFAGFDMAYRLLVGQEPRPIFALFTDSRQNGRDNIKKIDALKKEAVESQFPYRNLYVIGTIKDTDGDISPNVDKLIESIKEYYKKTP